MRLDSFVRAVRGPWRTSTSGPLYCPRTACLTLKLDSHGLRSAQYTTVTLWPLLTACVVPLHSGGLDALAIRIYQREPRTDGARSVALLRRADPTASGVQTHSPPMLPWYRPRGQQRQVVRAQELGEGSLPGCVKLVQSRVDLWRGRRLVPPESRRRAGRSGSVGGA